MLRLHDESKTHLGYVKNNRRLRSGKIPMTGDTTRIEIAKSTWQGEQIQNH